MKTYHVALWLEDCTEIDAENEAEARELAETVFRENGYNLAANDYALIAEEQRQ